MGWEEREGVEKLEERFWVLGVDPRRPEYSKGRAAEG